MPYANCQGNQHIQSANSRTRALRLEASLQSYTTGSIQVHSLQQLVTHDHQHGTIESRQVTWPNLTFL